MRCKAAFVYPEMLLLRKKDRRFLYVSIAEATIAILWFNHLEKCFPAPKSALTGRISQRLCINNCLEQPCFPVSMGACSESCSRTPVLRCPLKRQFGNLPFPLPVYRLLATRFQFPIVNLVIVPVFLHLAGSISLTIAIPTVPGIGFQPRTNDC